MRHHLQIGGVMARASYNHLVLGTALLLPPAAACSTVLDENGGEATGQNTAAGTLPPRTCATADPVESERFAEPPVEREGLLLPGVEEPVTIDVFFNVIMSSSGLGDVADDIVLDQVEVLNDAFASTGFAFTLHPFSITRVVNDIWFTMAPGSAIEADAKRALRRGTARDLNIYTVEPADGAIGWATWPWQASSDPAGDGVVLLHRALPWGDAVPFDEGDTATHEIGHWLGLHHTFQGGCSKLNDSVADTPAEAIPGIGCPFWRDTCPGSLFPGPDPTDNFMDFANDSCMVLFTEGQAERMQQHWQLYRADQ